MKQILLLSLAIIVSSCNSKNTISENEVKQIIIEKYKAM
jgi:hypothetical protein